MEEISKEQQLLEIQQALMIQGITTTIPVLLQIELTQEKIKSVGKLFTLKDAVEIRAAVQECFPIEKFPMYYPTQE